MRRIFLSLGSSRVRLGIGLVLAFGLITQIVSTFNGNWVTASPPLPNNVIATGASAAGAAGQLEALAKADHVRFLGRVPFEHLVYLYNAAQLLVHPSFYEGFGLPPLEAMTCGTPAIVSNVSALPEVVGDAALLIDPHDIEGLTVAMWRALTDEDLRASLIAKGLKRAQIFSWERAAQETLDVYRRVVG